MDGNLIDGTNSAVKEGFLGLIRDLTGLVGTDWHDIPVEQIKSQINSAISQALKTSI